MIDSVQGGDAQGDDSIASARPGLRRLALGVEYCGTAYHGWQAQRDPTMPSVQDALEKALSRIADQPVRTHCAGRTDAGVHALCQVVHFDTPVERPLKAWHLGTNTHLSDDLCVRWAQSVPSDFHARYRAQRRRYRYVIYNAPTRSAVLAKRVTWHIPVLDAELMHREVQCLVGRHDFTSYRATACQSRTPVREVFSVGVSRQGTLLLMDIEANAFLMHMIRNIVGVLMAVGNGKQAPGWAREVLDARDRRSAGVTAPPHGLYFLGASYAGQYGLPDWAHGPDFTFL